MQIPTPWQGILGPCAVLILMLVLIAPLSRENDSVSRTIQRGSLVILGIIVL